MSTTAVYITIFSISFFILSLQIILAILFQVIAFSPIFSLSLTFLGLSTAGIFSYIKYPEKDNLPLKKYTCIYSNTAGILLLLYTVAIKYHSLLTLKKEQLPADIAWNKKLMDIFESSIAISIGFVLLFFCLGIIISLVYRQHSDKSPKLYFWDLMGAASGCVFATVIFNFLQLSSMFILFSLFSFLLPVLISKADELTKPAGITAKFFIPITILLLLINLKTDFFEPKLNPNFLVRDWGLKQDCVEIWHRWNTYSRVSLIKHTSPENQHYSYDFSINNAEGLAGLQDFNAAAPFQNKPLTIFTPVASAFFLGRPQDILILFAGAGRDMLEAYNYSQGTSDITGVELNPLIVNKAVSLPEFHLKDFFAKKNVHMVIQEARNYLETTDKMFDAIILSWSGASAAQYLGIPNYTGQYLFTKEAFLSYLKHLKPNGTIGIVNINKFKLLAMAKEAFKELGDNDFPSKIIVFDEKEAVSTGHSKRKFFALSEEKTAVLIKKSGFSKEEIKMIEKTIAKMGLVWIYNPYYTHKDFKFIGKLIMTKNTENFLEKLSLRYRRNLELPVDDKPFAKNMSPATKQFKRKALLLNIKSIFNNKSRRPFSFNFFILLFNILLAASGLLFIILPLIFKKNKSLKTANLKFLLYFSILGIGFIAAEIGSMQIFTLFLGNPIYSFSLVLAGLLISAGTGGYLSGYLFEKKYCDIKKISLLSAFILLLYFFFLPQINRHLLFLGFYWKILITFALILPMGICLGMFFPQGFKKAYSTDKNLIPWAWGLNGYTGILGSLFSPYLSWALGFRCFFLVAAVLYLAIMFINIDEFNG